MRSRGVTTTSVAVGNDCDLSLLTALDDPAGLRRAFDTVTPANAADALVAAHFDYILFVSDPFV